MKSDWYAIVFSNWILENGKAIDVLGISGYDKLRMYGPDTKIYQGRFCIQI